MYNLYSELCLSWKTLDHTGLLPSDKLISWMWISGQMFTTSTADVGSHGNRCADHCQCYNRVRLTTHCYRGKETGKLDHSKQEMRKKESGASANRFHR